MISYVIFPFSPLFIHNLVPIFFKGKIFISNTPTLKRKTKKKQLVLIPEIANICTYHNCPAGLVMQLLTMSAVLLVRLQQLIMNLLVLKVTCDNCGKCGYLAYLAISIAAFSASAAEKLTSPTFLMLLTQKIMAGLQYQERSILKMLWSEDHLTRLYKKTIEFTICVIMEVILKKK